MDEKIKQFGQSMKDSFPKAGTKARKLIIAAFVLVLAIVGIAVTVNLTTPYAVLFTGLESEDVSSILAYLNETGVTDYKMENNDTILVPESREASLKAALIMEGYPSSGFGYSTYLDNINALSTESDRRTLYLFDLQDRLSATVRCFEGVKEATVTIAQGKNSDFVLNRENTIEAEAVVLVTMQGGQKLSDQQANAIRTLIGSAVQGLVIDNVSITDTAGNTYSGGDGASATGASQLKLALEEQINNKTRDNVMRVLAPLFGAENLSVGVQSTVDVSRKYLDSVNYKEPEWAADGGTGGEGIIGSKVYDNTIIRGENAAVGGAAGTTTNADINTYVEGYQPDGTEQRVGTSGEVNYNVPSERVQSESAAGVVTDLMVSVSINSAMGAVNTNELIQHVARAAGISTELEDEKISILAGAFYNSEAEPAPTLPTESRGIYNWVVYAAAVGVGLFLILLLMILLLRSKSKKGRKAGLRPEDIYMEQMAPASGADIMEIHTERSMELRKDVRQFAEDNPELAAQMVKSWLRGGEEEHG